MLYFSFGIKKDVNIKQLCSCSIYKHNLYISIVTTNESNANHLKSIFNKIILSFRASNKISL